MQRRAVDLFAGAGGATQGLRDAGFDVVAAVESDSDASSTWSSNHPGTMYRRDVRGVESNELMSGAGLEPGDLDLLKSCPPCQGFSSLRGGATPDAARNDLVLDTLRFVEQMQPRAVLLENVPGLAKDRRFRALKRRLKGLNYGVASYDVQASELGVPQRRRRLVVLALKDAAPPSDLADLVPMNTRPAPRSAGEALRVLAEGQLEVDPHHRWRSSTELTSKRLSAIPPGGTRFDLPAELQLECHGRLKAKNGQVLRAATASYGRVRPLEPAPTMTTRCTTPACGSFVHPTENRGLSLREAAAFQTFPADYRWSGGYDAIERQIGNAVPVLMAEVLGRSVLSILDDRRLTP